MIFDDKSAFKIGVSDSLINSNDISTTYQPHYLYIRTATPIIPTNPNTIPPPS